MDFTPTPSSRLAATDSRAYLDMSPHYQKKECQSHLWSREAIHLSTYAAALLAIVTSMFGMIIPVF
jgi:Mn-containing catalase